MQLYLPDPSLIVLIGPWGSGKSSFARRHFSPSQILSPEACRQLVHDQSLPPEAEQDAQELLGFIAGKRLKAGRLTVIDSSNVRPEQRKPLIQLAHHHHLYAVAVVLNVGLAQCLEKNAERTDRKRVYRHIHQQHRALVQSMAGLGEEGFSHVFTIESKKILDDIQVELVPLAPVHNEDHGPFDIIGDVHGCIDELIELLEKLGYQIYPSEEASLGYEVTPPPGRKAIFLGDLVDRGPGICEVLRLVMGMVQRGKALCLPGNHELKLLRKLKGKDVVVGHGLEKSIEQLQSQPELEPYVVDFLDHMVSHYVLDAGQLVVAHAGLKEVYHGRDSRTVREFCLYGETTGRKDARGYPIRGDWGAHYRGKATVVYGHTPIDSPQWVNRTINIDTGCVFGGRLTALRYPEKELVWVKARRCYYP